MRHYELTDETMEHEGVTLYRIMATRDFENQGVFVQAGTRGGWVEGYHNLVDNGWVSGEAKVWGHAKVSEQAAVFWYAEVFGNALVTGWSRVHGNAKVYGNTLILDDARVYGDTELDNGFINGDEHICD